MFIPESLETCIANSSCLTFESGSLLPDNKTEFQIDTMEIWGCGGDDLIKQGLYAQGKDRNSRDDLIRQARKVDKAAFADNAFDQEFLLSKTFAHKVKVADDV